MGGEVFGYNTVIHRMWSNTGIESHSLPPHNSTASSCYRRFVGLDQQDSMVGEGRDMDAGEVKALAQGVSAIEMGL